MIVPMPTLPKMYRLQQTFDRSSLEDPAAVLAERLRTSPAMDGLKPGMRVAITAGSRGIYKIGELVAAVAKEVRRRGGDPFVVPAMGSHGGATAEGQADMLRGLGVSEESVGCPIRSSMETVEVGKTPQGWSAYCDRNAFESDYVVVMNRIKAHTAFKSDIESGLHKMMTVGLGKHKGAANVHVIGLKNGVVPIGKVILEKAPIGVGIGIIENSEDKTYDFKIVTPSQFEEADREGLALANKLLPRIPFDQLDILIVREIGKNISGTGMDSNIIGIGRRIGGSYKPEITRLGVLDLTEKTHGNALGIGLADLTTRRLVDKIDYRATYTNVITTGFLGTARIPMILETDQEMVAVALNGYEASKVRMAIIQNTLELEHLLISEALVEEARQQPGLTVGEEVGPFQFDAEGNLLVSLHW